MKEKPIKEYTVFDMNNLGNGIAKDDDGKVVFIPGAIDGETVRAGVIKEASDYSVARLEGVMHESKHRKKPDCASFKTCGGCVFRHITYEHELELKRSFVAGAFAKNGLSPKTAPVIGSPRQDGYRNKVQYPIDDNYNFGYYARHSHRMVDSADCPLSASGFSDILRFAAGKLKEHSVRGVKNIYIRRGIGTGETMLCFVSSEKNAVPRLLAEECAERFPEIVSVILNYQPEDNNVILGKESITLYGKDNITDTLFNLQFEISPTSFYQVNREGCEVLYKVAADLLGPAPGENVGDIYCGIGTIGIYLASRFDNISVKGIEIVNSAIENAKRNAGLNGIKNADFICADASEPTLDGLDTFVVDPPRKGLSPKLIEKIKKSGAKRFVYVSCNPETLARDCKMLSDTFTVDTVHPVDMFPRTGHVESVVKLIRQ